jgi:hypothetical protein
MIPDSGFGIQILQSWELWSGERTFQVTSQRSLQYSAKTTMRTGRTVSQNAQLISYEQAHDIPIQCSVKQFRANPFAAHEREKPTRIPRESTHMSSATASMNVSDSAPFNPNSEPTPRKASSRVVLRSPHLFWTWRFHFPRREITSELTFEHTLQK